MRPLYFDFSLEDEFVQSATRENDPVVVHQFMFGMLVYWWWWWMWCGVVLLMMLRVGK